MLNAECGTIGDETEADHPDAKRRAPAPERVSRILSIYGAASRREADKMITAGRVTVNGTKAVLGQKADPESDTIAVDGSALECKSMPIYIMLNKPRGFLTTTRDERGRQTVMSLVGSAGARVYPVGRLDMDSEGLLLMTNDGDFANAVAHPSNNKAKVYEAVVAGDAAGAVPAMSMPMVIDGHTVRAESVELAGHVEGGGRLRISVIEGRNRQIRKMCAKCGLAVKTLKRISIGPLELGSLKTGEWRHLTKEEVMFFG